MLDQPHILLQSRILVNGRNQYFTIAESGATYGAGVAASLTPMFQPPNVPQLPEGVFRIVYVPPAPEE